MPAVPASPRILRASEYERISARPRVPPGAAAPPAGSLWLEASVADRLHTFELPARRERAIVAGSVRSADISIDDPRVSLIEFHFERAGDKVFVVPAYGARVEVNAIRLRRPEPIRERALVAFAGYVMKVRVFGAPPARAWLVPTVTEPDPPSDSPEAFGNDTIVTSFIATEDDDPKPEVDATDDTNTTLVFRPSASPSAPPACERTTSETPAAKLVHELPTPRAAPLELSELLALRAAANARLPSRRPPHVSGVLMLVASTACGFALGFAAAHLLPRPQPRTNESALQARASADPPAHLTRR